VFCKHNFEYTQGHFYCTKCGKSTHGKQKRRLSKRVKVSLIVMPIVIIGIVFAPSIIEYVSGLVSNVQNFSSVNPSAREQSPYGPKQTQYLMDQLRQQPRFMDCSDQQLIRYLNLEDQWSKQRAIINQIYDLKDPEVRVWYKQQMDMYNSLSVQYNRFSC